MSATKFILPETFSVEVKDKARYIRYLNKLAAAGYDTPKKLIIEPTKVIETIMNIVGDKDDDKARQHRRYFLSSIFWVLPREYRDLAYEDSPYRQHYTTAIQNYRPTPV